MVQKVSTPSYTPISCPEDKQIVLEGLKPNLDGFIVCANAPPAQFVAELIELFPGWPIFNMSDLTAEDLHNKFEPNPDPQTLTTGNANQEDVDYEPHPEKSLKISPEHQKIVDSICNLYSGSASEQDMQVYAAKSIYDDPWSYCDTRYKIAGQWYGIAKIFTSSKTFKTEIVKDTPTEMVFKLQQEYTPKGLHFSKVVDSLVSLTLDEEGMTSNTSASSSFSSLLPLKRPQNSAANSVYQGIVVETVDAPFEAPPWVISRYAQESLLRDEIQAWTFWAFGSASIDVSITATRAAILLAGTTRDVVKGHSREKALLAALKVESVPEFLTSCESSSIDTIVPNRHLSPFLMNVMLESDGPMLFDVAHASPRPSNSRSDVCDWDETEWAEPDLKVEYVLAKDVPESPNDTAPLSKSAYTLVNKGSGLPAANAKYTQRGQKKFVYTLPGNGSILTDMLPDTASRMNPQVLHFAYKNTYEWVDSKSWHMHDGGVLHIPEGALTQKLHKKPNKFTMWCRPNGSEDSYEIRFSSDLKHICSTQAWLMKLLGDGLRMPHFLFLPLGFRPQNATSPYDSWFQEDSLASFVGEPEVIGVVLVSHAVKTKDSPLSYWYKSGNYVAYGRDFAKLDWKEGIMVVSYKDEPKAKMKSVGDCAQHRDRVSRFYNGLKQNSAAEEGYEWIYHHEVMEKFLKVRNREKLEELENGQ